MHPNKTLLIVMLLGVAACSTSESSNSSIVNTDVPRDQSAPDGTEDIGGSDVQMIDTSTDVATDTTPVDVPVDVAADVPMCIAPEVMCAGRCTNTQTDGANCGTCGNACGAGTTCMGGVCRPTCAMGETLCGATCANTQSNGMNCGTCGRACPSDQMCSSGECVTTCAMGQTLCGAGGGIAGSCANLATDSANCGACGTVCGAGQMCSMGACVCPMGQTLCGSTCVTTQTDGTNCGTCGTVCAMGQTCVMGACACPAGQIFCAGACVNAQTSTTHCGMCGRACTSDQMCSSGSCVATCAMGQSLCGGTCTVTATDPRNCGACETVCPTQPRATPSCTAGTCGLTCDAGFGNCDGVASNGCETALVTSTHCGACGIACGSGFACTAGRCESVTCLPAPTCTGAACPTTCSRVLFEENWEAGTARWDLRRGGRLPINTITDGSLCTSRFLRETELYSEGRVLTRASIPVTPGRTYCAAGWIRGSVGTWPFIGIRASDAAGSIGPEHWLIGQPCFNSRLGGQPVSPVVSDNTWRWYARQFVMPSYNFILLELEIWDSGAAGTADFDNVQFIEGPCPIAPNVVCEGARCDDTRPLMM
jgi:hypothetical protein